MLAATYEQTPDVTYNFNHQLGANLSIHAYTVAVVVFGYCLAQLACVYTHLTSFMAAYDVDHGAAPDGDGGAAAAAAASAGTRSATAAAV